MYKTYNDFTNSLIFTRLYIVIPDLGRAKIEKTSFIVDGKYNVAKEKKYLMRIYNKYYGK